MIETPGFFWLNSAFIQPVPRRISALRIYVFSIFSLQAQLLIFEEPSIIAFHGGLEGRQISCLPTRRGFSAL
jgi:hypothetical protein